MIRVSAKGGPGSLRTYVDDWRIVAEGTRREAATRLIGALGEACDALAERGMKVNASKTFIMASGAADRAYIRSQAGERFGHMVTGAVKDLGVESALGPRRVTRVQRQRVEVMVESAKRVAIVPTGWPGRTGLALGLLRARPVPQRRPPPPAGATGPPPEHPFFPARASPGSRGASPENRFFSGGALPGSRGGPPGQPIIFRV